MRGWYGNKYSHSLASRGISVKCNTIIKEFPDYLDEYDNLDEIMYEYNKCVPYEEIYSGRAYAGTRHYDMNHFLLSGEKTKEYIHEDGIVGWNQEIMEKAIKDFINYLKNAPKYSGDVFRGTALDLSYSLDKELLEKIIKSNETGEPLNFGTFLSTSNKYSHAYNYIYGQDMPLEIYIHGGNNSGVYLGNAIFKVIDENDDYTQNEVVFPPDAKFKVVEFEENEFVFDTFGGDEIRSGYRLELEEL